ncbi:MAG: phosphoribosylamine--glycine ligase [Planctomycetes bacterium]|nr:phosphoribosylamine--glycine ligase [Planctomycetota bacterium]
MKVLIVGGGGREHALAWKIRQSPLVREVLVAPGNAGTAQIARNVAIPAKDVKSLVELAKSERVDLVVVGPEEPLVLGLADELRAAKIDVLGPGASGARLEGSKAFAKEFLEAHRIPTALSKKFDRSGAAKAYLEAQKQWPLVIKADGLAAGKGVFVVQSAREGCTVVDQLMEEKKLGAAGARIVIEEFLVGEEISVLGITDGETILILEPVMDHKQVGDGDTGPNTGGMGVVSPHPTLTPRVMKQIEQHVLVPTLDGLRREEIEFRGVIFAGLMLTDSGPRVLEYNCRFGDPETQAVMRRLKSDLVPYLVAAARGKLIEQQAPEWDRRACVGVVAASDGYPGEYRRGDPIEGLEAADALEDVVVFQAGTRVQGRQAVSDGGRVLCVTALGKDLEEARERAYAGYDRIRYTGKFARRDIGQKRPVKSRVAR